MIALPGWMLQIAAWSIAIGGTLVLVALCAWIAGQAGYMAVLGLQRALRAVGVYGDFWGWYRQQGRIFLRRRRRPPTHEEVRDGE